MTEIIQHINSFKEYNELVTTTACVIKFTGTWCGPCKRIAPKYQELATAHSGSMQFVEIDIDRAQQITEYENIAAIPMFLFYIRGELIPHLTVRGGNASLLEENIVKFSELAKAKKEVILVPIITKVENDLTHLTLDTADDFDEQEEQEPEPDEKITESKEVRLVVPPQECELSAEKTISIDDNVPETDVLSEITSNEVTPNEVVSAK